MSDVSAAPPAAARGLIGSSRAFFMKSTVEGCVEKLAAEAEIEKMPKDALVSICRCSAKYIADHVTPAQLHEPDTSEMRAIIAEATSACLDRHRRSFGRGRLEDRAAALIRGEQWADLRQPDGCLSDADIARPWLILDLKGGVRSAIRASA